MLVRPAISARAQTDDLLTLQFTIGQAGGNVTPGNFIFPFGLAVDSTGSILVTDAEEYGPGGVLTRAGDRLQIFHPDGTLDRVVGGIGSDAGQFSYPTSVAVDANDTIVVADAGNNRIQVFASAASGGAFLAQYGIYGDYDPLDTTGASLWPAPAPLNAFNFATGVALKPGTRLLDPSDTTGRLAIVDNGNHRVVVLNAQLQPVGSFGGHDPTNDGKVGTFEYPWGVAIDDQGQFYVADAQNHRVEVFDPAGNYLWLFGDDETSQSPSPGDLSSPSALTFDRQGRLLVADTDRSRILRIDVSTDLGSGSPLPRCEDDAAASQAHECQILTSDGKHYDALPLGGYGWWDPTLSLYAQGVATDAQDRVLVANTDAHQIQVFVPSKIEMTSASVSPAGGGKVDEPVTLTATVANTGASDLSVTLNVAASLPGVLTGDLTAPIPAGTDHTFTLTYTPSVDGSLTFTVGADGLHSTGALIPAASITTAAVTIQPAPAPSLFAAIAVDHSVAGLGSTIGVTLTLTNSGNTDFDIATNPPVVTLSPAGAVTPQARALDLSMLPAGTSRQLVYAFTAAQESTVTFTATVNASYSDDTGTHAYPVQTVSTPQVRILEDTTPPVTQALESLPAAASGWHLAPFTVMLSATDNAGGSGVKSITYSLTGIVSQPATTVNASSVAIDLTKLYQGTTTITFFATDNNGNVESPVTRTYKLDSIPPDLGRVMITPDANAAGWHNTDVAVAFDAGDATSGVASVTPDVTLTKDGIWTVTGTAVDKAGNTNSVTVVVKIDKTPPTLTCGTVSGGIVWPPNHKLVPWNTSVLVSDAMSGPAGGFTLAGIAINQADNGLADGNTVNDVQGFVLGTPDTSGFVRAERAGDGGARVYSLTYHALDIAGNVGSCTTTTATVPHDRSGKPQ